MTLPNPIRFAVTSQGRTASYWLAAVLNDHPDIICGHSKQVPPVPRYFVDADPLGIATPLKPLDEIYRDQSALPADPASYYALLERAGEARAYGTVHAYDISETPALKASSPAIVTAHLTRHPVVRIDSLTERSIAEMAQSANIMRARKAAIEDNLNRFLGEGLPYQYDEIIATRSQTTEVDWWAFVGAAFDVAGETIGLPAAEFIVPSERLTHDPDYLAFLVDHLCGQQVVATAPWLEAAYGHGRLNGVMTLRGRSAIDVFSNWPDWKQFVFSRFCRRYPIAERFSAAGYSFSGLFDADGHPARHTRTMLEQARLLVYTGDADERVNFAHAVALLASDRADCDRAGLKRPRILPVFPSQPPAKGVEGGTVADAGPQTRSADMATNVAQENSSTMTVVGFTVENLGRLDAATVLCGSRVRAYIFFHTPLIDQLGVSVSVKSLETGETKRNDSGMLGRFFGPAEGQCIQEISFRVPESSGQIDCIAELVDRLGSIATKIVSFRLNCVTRENRLADNREFLPTAMALY